LALTKEGLAALGLSQDELETFSFPFLEGMNSERRQRVLGDIGPNDPKGWDWGGQGQPEEHILLTLFAPDSNALEVLLAEEQRAWVAQGLVVGHVLPGCRNPSSHEHFGFQDGIGQPMIKGSPNQGKQLLRTGHETEVNAGEFVLGYVNEDDVPAPGPTVPASRDPRNLLPTLEQLQLNKLSAVPAQHDLGVNGSYLVFRQLKQDVAAFWEAVYAASGLADVKAEYFAAKSVGRWRSGMPLMDAPEEDPTPPGAVVQRNNFDYRMAESKNPDYNDPDGLRCPIGAHIRRSNPRDTLGPVPEQALDSARRHRIMRRGRSYGDHIDYSVPIAERIAAGANTNAADKNRGTDRGLHFICLCADLERQFEVIQQVWITNPNFSNLNGEVDPLVANFPTIPGTFTIPGNPVAERIRGMSRFVTVRGGAYFFLPSRAAIEFLAAL